MPALRPPGSGSSRAPAICAAAIASIDPIIHGSGTFNHANAAPPRAHTTRAPATGATFFASKLGVASRGPERL